MTTPWVELHRPKNLDDIQHQPHVVSAFKEMLISGQVPHLLLFGPQGTGKTTAMQALAHQLFGPKFYHRRVYEFNASADRGVSVIRDRVKTIAQHQVAEYIPEEGYPHPVPRIQLIILEEADALTRDAQTALRRIVEDHAETTRVALLCNYPSQLIEPLVSRCAKFRFSALPVHCIKLRIEQICAKESIIIGDKEVCETLAKLSGGDMRAAVNTCQMLSQFRFDSANLQKLLKLKGQPTDELVSECINKATSAAISDENFLNFITNQLVDSGIDLQQLIVQFSELFVRSEGYSDRKRAVVGREFGRFGGALARRVDERIASVKFFEAVRAGCLFE